MGLFEVAGRSKNWSQLWQLSSTIEVGTRDLSPSLLFWQYLSKYYIFLIIPRMCRDAIYLGLLFQNSLSSKTSMFVYIITLFFLDFSTNLKRIYHPDLE